MESSSLYQLQSTPHKTLNRFEWLERRELHRSRVLTWVEDRVNRANQATKHPVYDFLFTYYSFRPAHLLRWSPGADIELAEVVQHELDWPRDFTKTARGWIIPSSSFPAQRHEYLLWALNYLTSIESRSGMFCCYGLHEWAMVYKSSAPRHSQVPLRLSSAQIAQVVEESELRCTHYDAYRFFTPEATPRNRSLLSRRTTTEFDQPGCIHVTMDLYKFAHKIAPWCPSELVAGTFILAADARAIDMRASPYDLSEYGLKAIEIETACGRSEYIAEQRALSERAAPLRRELITVYSELIKRT